MYLPSIQEKGNEFKDELSVIKKSEIVVCNKIENLLNNS